MKQGGVPMGGEIKEFLCGPEWKTSSMEPSSILQPDTLGVSSLLLLASLVPCDLLITWFL